MTSPQLFDSQPAHAAPNTDELAPSQPAQGKPAVLTYEESGRYLGVGVGRVKELISRQVLHPIKRARERTKYIRQDELDWYLRRKAGEDLPNPVFVERPMGYWPAVATAVTTALRDPGTIGEWNALDAKVNQTTRIESAYTQLVQATLPFIDGLLVEVAAKRPLSREQLERLRKSPEYGPVRQALIDLAELAS